MEQQCGVILECGGYRWWLHVHECEVIGQVWAKNTKLRIHRLVSGVPCKMEICGNTIRWWVQVNDMWQCRGCTFMNARPGDWVENPKAKCLQFGFRHTM